LADAFGCNAAAFFNLPLGQTVIIGSRIWV
jgi:hypothetical protein